MMKLVVRQMKNGCRLGQIVELARHPEITLETPLCLLYTKAGCVPYLTREMLDKVDDIPKAAHCPIVWGLENLEAIEEYKMGVGKFTAMKDYILYNSVQDVAAKYMTGYNDKHGTATWGKGGKVHVSADLFVRLQQAFQADMCQCLCDSDTDATATKKRSHKAVDRTLDFLDKCLEKWDKSEVLQKCSLFGVIEGGFYLEERLRSARETAKKPVAGFSIEGFHGGGPDAENFSIPEVKDIISKVVEVLPEDKPRLMHGVWRPDQVVKAVQLGIDIFDSSYPYLESEKGSALVFNYILPKPNQVNDVNGQAQNAQTEADTDQSASDLPCTSPTFSINLNDKRYFDDLTPILPHCTCYTCKQFTKAYICHLLNTSELLAGVLLMMHNLHHYYGFFAALRDAIHTDRLQDLEELICGPR